MTEPVRRFRPVAALGCTLAVLAMAPAIAAQQHHAQVRTRVVTAFLPAPLVRVVAGDCPPTTICAGGPAPSIVTMTVEAAFPAGRLVDAFAVFGTGTAATYREYVRLSLPRGGSVDMTSRCTTGGAAVRPKGPGSVPAAGPASLVIVVPGSVGCSVAVVVIVAAGVSVPVRAARLLAGRAVLQITR